MRKLFYLLMLVAGMATAQQTQVIAKPLKLSRVNLGVKSDSVLVRGADKIVKYIPRTALLEGIGGGAIDESNLVHKTGTEVIEGEKSFADAVTLHNIAGQELRLSPLDIKFKDDEGHTAQIVPSFSIDSGSNTYVLPNQSGTFALVGDVPTIQQVVASGNNICCGLDITTSGETEITTFGNGYIKSVDEANDMRSSFGPTGFACQQMSDPNNHTTHDFYGISFRQNYNPSTGYATDVTLKSIGKGRFVFPTKDMYVNYTIATTSDDDSLPVFSGNAAAIAGGLTLHKKYRTSTGQLMIVY